jgi:hypothetical protein
VLEVTATKGLEEVLHEGVFDERRCIRGVVPADWVEARDDEADVVWS